MLIWYCVGFAVVQLSFALAIDQSWTSVRDPDFHDMVVRLRARLAEHPGRPLVLVLGSSRSLMGIDAAALTRRSGDDGPLVFNGSFASAGSMMLRVTLRRLLDEGIRPDGLLFEVLPSWLSARDGRPCEEGNRNQARFSCQEIMAIGPCFEQPNQLLSTWGLGRLFPCGQHAVELRDATRLEWPKSPANRFGRDDYGWSPWEIALTPEETKSRTDTTMKLYSSALGNPATSPGAMRAYRKMLQTCSDERIRTAVFCAPEGAVFREFDRDAGKRHFEAARGEARSIGLPFVDARDWCDDADFLDGHHLAKEPARRYTERFGRELLPLVELRDSPPVPAQAVSHVRP